MTSSPLPPLLAPERVAVLRRRAWRVLLVVSVPVVLVTAGVAAYAGRWLFVPVGVAVGLLLGGSAAGLLTTPTLVRTMNASMTIPGLDRGRARHVGRAIRTGRPDLLRDHEVPAARRYAEVRLGVRALSGPSSISFAALPFLLLPALVRASETPAGIVVVAAVTCLLVPLFLLAALREGPALRRFLDETAARADDEPGRG